MKEPDYSKLKKGNIPNHICIHKTAKKSYIPPIDYTPEEVQKIHMETRGWGDCGYHYIVTKSGEVIQMRALEYIPASATGHNRNVCAIALQGDFDIEDPTPVQFSALVGLCRFIMEAYCIYKIIGHRDYKDPAGTITCPGKRMYARLPELRRLVLSGGDV